MPRRAYDPRAVAEVLAAFDVGVALARGRLRMAVLYLLHALAERAPGRSVEVRVPPFGVVQCGGGAGPVHRRGTPPNVVETDPVTWVQLAAGRLSWGEAVAQRAVAASGARADLREWLPVWPG